MLAVNLPDIHLLGVSTVGEASFCNAIRLFLNRDGQTHGNASSDCTAVNAARCLLAFGAPSNILVYPGASEPLLLPAKHDPEIHGEDGLGGVEGLPACDDPNVLALFALDEDGLNINALEGIARHIKAVWKHGLGEQVTIISTGPMTNIALFISVYKDLLPAIEQLVFMGGAVGLGNRSAVAEYNILCDRKSFYSSLLAKMPASNKIIQLMRHRLSSMLQ